MEHTQQTQRPGRATRGRLVAGFVACVGHLVGVMTCGALMLALGMPEHSMSLVSEALREGLVLGEFQLDGAILFGLSMGIWGVTYGSARHMLGRHGRGPRGVKVQRVATLSRGSVMTETLIVIPVYLLVMLGSIQLAQNAIAGLMTTLAAFQAGRTAAVWIPEAQVGRNGVDDDVVRDKVRSTAAGIVAPMVPVNFNTRCGEAGTSPTMQKMLAGMATAGHVNLPDASLAFARLSGADRFLNVAEGFDSMQMSLRGSAKLRFAYCAVDVENAVPGGSATNGYVVTTEGDVEVVTTTITYYHQATMPIVAKIFGDFKTIGERPAYYAPITRTYKTPIHADPNPVSPLEGIF